MGDVNSRQDSSNAPATVTGVHDVETLVSQEALAITRKMQCASIWASVPQKLAQFEAQSAYLVTRQSIHPKSCDNSTHLDD